jgi:hypothetical protein
VDQICREIATIRGAKDVARNTDIEAKVGKSEEAIAEVGKYRKVIAELTEIDEKVQSSISALVDWTRKNRRSAFLGWVLSAVVGGLITAIVTAWVLIRTGLAKP